MLTGLKVERSWSEIEYKCRVLGRRIEALFPAGLKVVILLDGGIWFGTEVLKVIEKSVPVEVSFAKIRSFHGTARANPEWVLRSRAIPHVVLDDFADSGQTVAAVKSVWPNSFVCTLFKRYNCRFPPDLYGFEVQHDFFLVGFGLDWNGCYRNLPTVYYIPGRRIHAAK